MAEEYDNFSLNDFGEEFTDEGEDTSRISKQSEGKHRLNMDNIVTENFFLLEFLVDKVELYKEMKRFCCPRNQTCVSIQFLDNSPLDICEKDFVPRRKYSKPKPNVTSGKSCLFSLTPEQAQDAAEEFNLHVCVLKILEGCGGQEKIELGTCTISVVNLFTQIIAHINARPDETSPVDKTIKDEYPIENSLGDIIGTLGMYIRMSCFGKLIVTQFQMNLKDRSILFKDKQGNSLYKYKKHQDEHVPTCFCPKKDGPCPPTCPALQPPVCPLTCPAWTQATPPPCIPPDEECIDIDDHFNEIGATMGKNIITLRVNRERGVEKMYEQSENDDDDTSYKCSQVCRPKGFIPPPPVPRDEQPFSFKLGGCGMNAGGKVRVLPPVYNAPDGTQITEISDPKRDQFILRVSKRVASMKKNLNLELCGPSTSEL
ncbi:hypothetical protein FQR65_LT13619, partial [Abscondita terminalis]